MFIEGLQLFHPFMKVVVKYLLSQNIFFDSYLYKIYLTFSGLIFVQDVLHFLKSKSGICFVNLLKETLLRQTIQRLYIPMNKRGLLFMF